MTKPDQKGSKRGHFWTPILHGFQPKHHDFGQNRGVISCVHLAQKQGFLGVVQNRGPSRPKMGSFFWTPKIGDFYLKIGGFLGPKWAQKWVILGTPPEPPQKQPKTGCPPNGTLIWHFLDTFFPSNSEETGPALETSFEP